ncbi:MAG: hypothetical protein J7K61_02365 [Thermoplasmata archaeon]|nr:hypothetical protein [Thermoplasmata archaeon]
MNEKGTRDCPLNLSDWINFLQNRQITAYSISNIIVMLSITIYSMSFSLITSNIIPEPNYITIGTIFLMAIILINTVVGIKNAFRNIPKIKKLIDEIIDGKLTDPNLIREKWKNIEK